MIKSENIPVEKINKYGFLILFVVLFLLIFYKVFNIPITHDETATTVHYCNFSYWQIMMYPDNWPNNHILNTIMVKFLISIFGAEQWVVRFPNLMSFLLYALAIYRINKAVLKTSSVFFIPAAVLFICNPYLLDFFGLSRGYAMSCALCTLSVSYLITGFMLLKQRNIWFAFFLAMLASYANFTLLVFLVAVLIFVWLFFIIRHRTQKKKIIFPTVLIILFFVGYAALIAVPIIKMQTTNQFQFWESAGFYKATILPLVTLSLYGSKWSSEVLVHVISIFVIVAVSGGLIYIFVKFIRSKFNLESFREPIFVASGIITLTALVNIFQCVFMRTPNLTGRTALFFFPLFVIVIVALIGLIKNQNVTVFKGVISLIVSVLFLFQLSTTMTLKNVKEWWFDENTFEVIDYFHKTRTNQNVSLKTNWLFHPSFYFYKYTGKIPLIDLKNYDKNIDVNTDAEYYYIMAEDFPVLEPKFEVAYKVNNERWLLKRKAQ